MCVSQTLIDCGGSQELLVITNCKKGQYVAGEGAVWRQGSTFLGQTSLLWLLQISTSTGTTQVQE